MHFNHMTGCSTYTLLHSTLPQKTGESHYTYFSYGPRVVPQNEKNDNGEKSEMSLGQRRGHVGVGLEWYG